MGVGNIRCKKTKIGLIPNNWGLVKLKEIAHFKNGANFAKKEVCTSGILMADVLNMYGNSVCIDTSKFYRVNKHFSDDYILNKGDILFVRSSLKREGVGWSALFEGFCEPVSFCGFLIRARLINDEIYPKYLTYFLRAPKTRGNIIALSGTVAITNIGQESLGLLHISVPSKPEQNKIAEILSTVDDAIEKTDAIIKETEQLKKGLMQKFFVRKAFTLMKLAKSEKTNLKPIYFKDFGRIITGTTPSTKVEKYYKPPSYMFAGPADLGKKKIIFETEKYISEDGFSVSRRLPKNAMMVVCIGATIGKVGITSEPCTSNQQINSIVPKKQFPTDYIYYVLSGVKNYLAAFSGDTATPILNKGEFGRIVVFVHKDYNKRVEITSILSELDTKIENEQNTKAKLEQLKKGLMQVLLIGKVRVKV